MSAEEKSRLRNIYFSISFYYVLSMTTIMFVFHLYSYDVVSFLPIFGSTTAFLSSLGIANYFTTPKDT